MYHYDPLMESALAALEREARTNPDAARLWGIIESVPPISRTWGILAELDRFDGCVKSRPALMSVILKELSAAFPVPLSLMQ